jgi:hypothetical protein
MTQDRIPLAAGSSRPAMEAREALIARYAEAAKRNAIEMSRMPIGVVLQHFREFADELAALPATPAVEGVEQTITGETVAGVPVVAWLWETDVPADVIPGGKVNNIAYHWSTPPSNADVTRLVDASAISRLVKERDEKQAALQRIADEHLPHVEALEASVARLTALLAEAVEVVKPFALPDGWHFIAYNKTGSTACPLNAGEVDAARRYQQKREAK